VSGAFAAILITGSENISVTNLIINTTTSDQGAFGTLRIVSSSHIAIRSVHINLTSTSGVATTILMSLAVDDLLIEDCTIINNGVGAVETIETVGTTTNAVFRRCKVIHNAAPDGSLGFILLGTNSDILFDACTVIGNNVVNINQGFRLSHSGTHSNILFIECYASNLGQGFVIGDDESPTTATDIYMKKCNAEQCATGFAIHAGTNIYLQSNVSHNNSIAGFTTDALATNCYLFNNSAYGNGTDNYIIDSIDSIAITADPTSSLIGYWTNITIAP
jgi:hypothetical protein